MGVGGLGFRTCWPWDTGVKPIPAGWTRDVAFTDRFLQGSDAAFAGAANGGGAHTHTDPGHTHVGNPHRHTFIAAIASGITTSVHTGPFPFLAPLSPHAHVSADSSWATITYSTDAAVINNADMKPPWVKASILKPDDIGQDIPDDAVCFGDSADLPTGFQITDGAGGTDDLDTLFVIGTDAEANGGDTGGSATHTHTSQLHNHDPDNHFHARKRCGTSTATAGIEQGISAPPVVHPSAHHEVTLDPKVLADVSNENVTIQAASSEPAHIKLLGIQNTSGSAVLSPGVVLPFVGAYADLPSSGEWILCDGTGGTQNCDDKQVKITTSTGEIGDTGGSNTHTHTVTDHGHAHGVHNHGATEGDIVDAGVVDTPSVSVMDGAWGHNHVWTIGNATPTMQTATITLSTDDGRFDYRTVIWVKYAPADVTVKILGGTSLLGTTAIAAA